VQFLIILIDIAFQLNIIYILSSIIAIAKKEKAKMREAEETKQHEMEMKLREDKNKLHEAEQTRLRETEMKLREAETRLQEVMQIEVNSAT